jgi:hypothetical protein
MMDELRDYRFYAEDMLHPNQVAIDYIWKRFKETNISETAFVNYGRSGKCPKVYLINRSTQLRESSKFEAKLKDKIATFLNIHL